ncbi:MAG: nitroreductase family protein [Clostridia bacterium]
MNKDIIKVIEERRSTRAYKDLQLTEVQLEEILHAALLAPSARNLQSCTVVALQDKDILAELNKDFLQCASKYPEYAGYLSKPGYNFYHHAPTFIFIFGDNKNKWSHVDAGIIVENMALAAEGLALGSCIIGMLAVFLATPEGLAWLPRLGAPIDTSFIVGLALGVKNEVAEAKPRDTSKIKRL